MSGDEGKESKLSSYDHLRAARNILPYPNPQFPSLQQVIANVERLITAGTPPTPEGVVLAMGLENMAETSPEFWERIRKATESEPDIDLRRERARQGALTFAHAMHEFEMLMRVYEGGLAWDLLYALGIKNVGDTTVQFWEHLVKAAHSMYRYEDAEKARKEGDLLGDAS